MLSFYGVSVTQLAMMTPNNRRFKSLVKLINNPLSGRIRETKEHAIYLKGMIGHLTYGYNDPQVKSLERKLKLASSTELESFSNPLRPQVKTKSPEEIQKEIEDLVQSKGLGKELLNSFEDLDGNKVILSEGAFEVLRKYLELHSSKLDTIIDGCIEGVLSEIRIFGRSPSALFNRPGILEYAVTEMMKGDGRQLPFQEVYKRIEREVALCREIVERYDTKDVSEKATKSNLDEACTPSAFMDYIESRDLPEEEVEVLQTKFLEFNPSFIEGVMEFVSKGYIKVPEMNYLVDFYFEIYLMDHSPTYIRTILGIENDEIDIDGVYSELNNIGLYYFNRDNLRHFLEALRSIVLGEEEGRLNVDSEPEYGTKTFRQAFRDLEYGFLSLAPSGSLVGKEDLNDTVSV